MNENDIASTKTTLLIIWIWGIKENDSSI